MNDGLKSIFYCIVVGGYRIVIMKDNQPLNMFDPNYIINYPTFREFDYF